VTWATGLSSSRNISCGTQVSQSLFGGPNESDADANADADVSDTDANTFDPETDNTSS